MSTEIQKTSVRGLLSNESVKQRFQEILKGNASGFCANLAVMVSNSTQLLKCDPMSVVSAAVVSASLNLPLDPNLGFAAIVPFRDKATFQVMYKGLIQLAQRSGQYKTIGVSEIYKGELISENRLTGEYVFDFSARESNEIIGYAAYFKLINGFEKTVYWTVEKVKIHATKYSQTYKSGYGKWIDDFDSMAKKTVLKNLLSKWGILSIELQRAVITDQSVINGINEDADVEYIDNIQNVYQAVESDNPLSIQKEEKPQEGKLL